MVSVLAVPVLDRLPALNNHVRYGAPRAEYILAVWRIGTVHRCAARRQNFGPFLREAAQALIQFQRLHAVLLPELVVGLEAGLLEFGERRCGRGALGAQRLRSAHAPRRRRR